MDAAQADVGHYSTPSGLKPTHRYIYEESTWKREGNNDAGRGYRKQVVGA